MRGSQFFHELSHAIGATLCCNRVTGIEISMDEGGLCTYQGSRAGALSTKCCVLPAGYIGSAIWGCGIVVATGWEQGPRGATPSARCLTAAAPSQCTCRRAVVGILLSACLLVAVFYGLFGVAKGTSERFTIISVALFFLGLVGGLTVLDFLNKYRSQSLAV